MVIEIILGVSVLLNLIFLYGVRNLNRQNEQYQDYIENELVSNEDVKTRVESISTIERCRHQRFI